MRGRPNRDLNLRRRRRRDEEEEEEYFSLAQRDLPPHEAWRIARPNPEAFSNYDFLADHRQTWADSPQRARSRRSRSRSRSPSRLVSPASIAVRAANIDRTLPPVQPRYNPWGVAYASSPRLNLVQNPHFRLPPDQPLTGLPRNLSPPRQLHRLLPGYNSDDEFPLTQPVLRRSPPLGSGGDDDEKKGIGFRRSYQRPRKIGGSGHILALVPRAELMWRAVW